MKHILSAWVLVLPVLAVAQPFQVQSNRPYTKGEKFRVESVVTARDQLARFENQKGETNEVSRALALTGAVQIAEVDAKGLPKEIKILIESFKETEGGRTRVVIPSGQTLTIAGQTNGPTSFRLQEGDVMPVVEDRGSYALGRIFLEEAIVAPSPQKVGGEWSIDPKIFAKRLPENMVMERDASATGRLTGTTNLFGQECMVVQVTATGPCAPNFGLDAQMRKQGAEFHGASFKMTYEGLLPTNSAARPVLQRLTTFVAATNHVAGSSGKAGIVHFSQTESVTKMLPTTNEKP